MKNKDYKELYEIQCAITDRLEDLLNKSIELNEKYMYIINGLMKIINISEEGE